jgi:hypothetical protein
LGYKREPNIIYFIPAGKSFLMKPYITDKYHQNIIKQMILGKVSVNDK